MRAALDVVLGRRPERVDRAGDQADHGQQEQHVDSDDASRALVAESLHGRAER
jgi:hypothetical protein